MFGYVRPAADRLTQEQTDLFRSAYCGLCRTMGHRCGAVSRLFLNYDLTFLAILLTGLYEPETKAEHHRCIPHPFQKHQMTEMSQMYQRQC